jgi:hypothetical protein
MMLRTAVMIFNMIFYEIKLILMYVLLIIGLNPQGAFTSNEAYIQKSWLNLDFP